MAAIVLVSALSIPIIDSYSGRSSTDNEENKPRSQRLTSLLRASKIPTRESLLKEAVSIEIQIYQLPSFFLSLAWKECFWSA
jgi:hypothetical protein